jgi:hypothetical protein
MYFYSWGDPENLRKRKLRTREKREVSVFITNKKYVHSNSKRLRQHCSTCSEGRDNERTSY